MATVIELPPPSASLSPALSALLQATDQLAEQVPADQPGSQALTETAVLLATIDKLTAIALRRVADVDKRGLYDLDGSPTTASWVAQQQTGMDRGDVALAKRLDRFPQLSQRVFDGLPLDTAQRIGAALVKLRRHVDEPSGLIDGLPAEDVLQAVIVDGVLGLICQARGGMEDDDPRLASLTAELQGIADRCESELARLESAFLVLARCLEPADLPSALSQLVDALLPQRLQDESDRAFEERGLDLRRKFGGSGWTVDGELDDECGELLHTVLAATAATDEHNPTDTAAWAAQRADGAEDPLDVHELDGCDDAPRSLRKRRHDALKLGLRKLLDSGALGLRDKVAPHINVTVSLEAMKGAPGAMPAVAASGNTLPLHLVREWMCNSAMTRFVLGLGRKVIETSHTERTLKRHERRAKHVETGGRCQGAGCTRGPGHRLIPHHPVPYSVNPKTSLSDSVLLCEQSHHDIHVGGKTIRLKDGRHLSPQGWVDGPRR
jgi:hypothetical protein